MKQREPIIVTLANLLPPVFVCLVVTTLWIVYVWFHLLPMSRIGQPPSEVEVQQYFRFVWQTAVSQYLSVMFLVCFLRALFGHSGTVPNDPEWLTPSKVPLTEPLTIRECKSSTGHRRFCKWCQRYKPDRSHHCRVCNTCVLRMDHHCPWIMNCVGFNNHKIFFLLVVYAVADLLFIICTMSESVERAVNTETPAETRFFLVLGMVVASIMFVLVSTFLSFHTWLMFKGMTTIEFCEKTLSGMRPITGVSYDMGYYQNVKNVLGPHWWLWLLPIYPAEGSGLNFPTKEKMIEEITRGEPEWTGQEETRGLEETREQPSTARSSR